MTEQAVAPPVGDRRVEPRARLTPGSGRPVRMRWQWLDWPGYARRTAAAAFLALLTWALVVPASAFEDVVHLFPHQDKLAHGGMFLALALLMRWALPEKWGYDRRRMAVLAVLTLYAASMEVLQSLGTASGRTFEWLDMACNQAGLFAGWALFPAAAAGEGRIPLLSGDRAAGAGATTKRRTAR